jgi:hypothetical protein
MPLVVSKTLFLARRETMPFYRSKSTVYNVWVTCVLTPYFSTKLILQDSWAACFVRLNCLKEHDDVLALRWSPRGCAIMEVVRIPVHALMHVLDTDLEADYCLGNGLLLSGLTGFHAIDSTKVYFLICNRNLACDKGIRLDCCGVIVATGDFGMVVIMLGRLYFMLSCWLAPTDASYMQYGRRAGSGATCTFTGPHLS